MELEQYILNFVGIAVLSAAFYLSSRKNERRLVPFCFVALSTVLLVLAAVGPNTILNLSLKTSPDGTELGFERSPLEYLLESKVIESNKSNEDLIDAPLLEEAKQLNPSERSAGDYLLLATDAWRREDFLDALLNVYTGLALSPEDKRLKSTLLYRAATIFSEIESPDDLAMTLYTQSIELDEKFAWPENGIALLHNQFGQYAEAEEHFRKAIKLDPTYSFPYNGLAIRLFEKAINETDSGEKGKLIIESEELFRKAISLDPLNPVSFFNLANLLNGTSRLSEAEYFYRRTLELKPEDYLACLGLLDVMVKQGKGSNVNDLIEKIVKLTSPTVDAYVRLASSFTNYRIFNVAEQLYRKAIEIDPNRPKTYYELAELFYKMGKIDESIEYTELGKKIEESLAGAVPSSTISRSQIRSEN